MHGLNDAAVAREQRCGGDVILREKSKNRSGLGARHTEFQKSRAIGEELDFGEVPDQIRALRGCVRVELVGGENYMDAALRLQVGIVGIRRGNEVNRMNIF